MEGFRTPSPMDPAQRTCGFCRVEFASRNSLFKHLKSCEAAKTGTIRPPPETEKFLQHSATKIALPAIADADNSENYGVTSYQIKEAPMLTKEIDGSLLSSYTHLRVQAFASPQDTPLEICIDPGTSRSFIDRKFLKTLEHNVEPRRGAARGIGGREKTSEWATFSFYLLGKDSSNTPTFMRITKAP